MEFYTGYDALPPCDAEYNEDEESMTECDGYIPLATQISNLLTAGISLNEYRRALYNSGDYTDDEDETDADPVTDITAQPSFDEFTALDYSVAVTDRLRKQAEASAEAQRQLLLANKQADYAAAKALADAAVQPSATPSTAASPPASTPQTTGS